MSIAADSRWARIVARDPAADGSFWYAVTTTGVYCRPTCPSRRANPVNVAIYDTQDAARKAGFRPCKRCKPDGLRAGSDNARLIARACQLIDSEPVPPSLSVLAATFDLSPGYFHRVFKAVTGVTPKAYASARRAARLRDTMAASDSVTAAIYDGGFNSSGRFYENSTAILGMTPTQYRAGGLREELRFAVGQCSLGAILVASSRKGVASILLGEDPDELLRDLQDRFPKADLIGGDRSYESWVARVVGLVEEPALGFDLPLDIRGTAFQRRVWEALRKIPPGKTLSYAQVAASIGSPGAVRAVAGACAANAHAVAIPCHRVVRSDGGLCGYRWGVERKRRLIEREAPAL